MKLLTHNRSQSFRSHFPPIPIRKIVNSQVPGFAFRTGSNFSLRRLSRSSTNPRKGVIVVPGMTCSGEHVTERFLKPFRDRGYETFPFTWPYHDTPPGTRADPWLGALGLRSLNAHLLKFILLVHAKHEFDFLGLVGQSTGGLGGMMTTEDLFLKIANEETLLGGKQPRFLDALSLINPAPAHGLNRMHRLNWGDIKTAWGLRKFWRILLSRAGRGKTWQLPLSLAKDFLLNDHTAEEQDRIAPTFVWESGKVLGNIVMGSSFFPAIWSSTRVNFEVLRSSKLPIFIGSSKKDRLVSPRSVIRLRDKLRQNHPQPELIRFRELPGDHHPFGGRYEESIGEMIATWMEVVFKARSHVSAA